MDFTSRPLPAAPDLNQQRYAEGDQMHFTMGFNQPVAVTGDPEIIIKIIHHEHTYAATQDRLVRPVDRTFTYDASLSQPKKHVFTYTVVGHDNEQIFYLPPGSQSWQLDDDDSIKDGWRQAGSRLDAILDHDSKVFNNHLYSDVPRVRSVEIRSTPTKGTNVDTYGQGDEIKIEVTLNHHVTVTGDPEFIIALGQCPAGCATLTYQASQSTTKKLVFTYTVTASDTSNGFYMGGQTTNNNDPLHLDSDDSIKHNTNHQDADLQFRTLGTQSDHKVDGSL